MGWGCVRVARCLAFETGPNKYHPSLVCLVFFLVVLGGFGHPRLPARYNSQADPVTAVAEDGLTAVTATMAPAEGEASAAFGDDVKPYKIHVSPQRSTREPDRPVGTHADRTLKVSTKYLDLTRQKLELTRLPHDIPRPRSSDWWDPKPVVEPLVDFW